MWLQFILQNAHFALSIIVGLVFFAVGWLYFDAWTVRKTTREGIRFIGFFLLALSFITDATFVENVFLVSHISSLSWIATFTPVIRIVGYVFVLVSVIIEPLQIVPKIEEEVSATTRAAFLPLVGLGVSVDVGAGFVAPVLALVIALVYLRRATIGLERHLVPVAISFLLLAFSEFVGLSRFYRTTTNIDIYRLVAPFGPLWIVEHMLLLSSILLIRSWVFGYLLKRFETQLFMIFTSTIIVIFLITTMSFTGLLAKNLVDTALGQLTTDAKVLLYAIESKRSETLSSAELIARDQRLIDAVIKKDRQQALGFIQAALLAKKHSMLTVVSDAGIVMARADDPDRYGDSLSNDDMVKRALSGNSLSTITTVDGVAAQELLVVSATPITNGTAIIGVVIEGTILDNAFLEGVKKATGLDASLFALDIISATTITAQDGMTRPVGIKLSNPQISKQVLEGHEFSGQISLLNRPYFAVFLPVLDMDNTPRAMVSVAMLETQVLATAGRSIELTFVIVIGLILASVIPSYFVSRSLVTQIK